MSSKSMKYHYISPECLNSLFGDSYTWVYLKINVASRNLWSPVPGLSIALLINQF